MEMAAGEAAEGSEARVHGIYAGRREKGQRAPAGRLGATKEGQVQIG